MTMEFSTKAIKKLSSKELESTPVIGVFKTEDIDDADKQIKANKWLQDMKENLTPETFKAYADVENDSSEPKYK